MLKRLQHIILLAMLLFSILHTTAQVAMPDTVCVGATRIYKVNDATVPSTYTWKIGSVTQPSVLNSISITWNVPGVFQLSVQEHTAGGCDGDIQTGLVYVNAPPVPNAGPDARICFGTTYRLNGSGGITYQWLPPGNLSNPALANPLFSPPTAGVFQYVLNVGDAAGCRSVNADTVNITVLQQPKIFAGNDTSVSVGQPVQLHAADFSNSGFINYLWTPGSGLNNSFIKDPVALISQVGSFRYVVTARTVEGCEAKDDIVIKVFSKPEIYVPNAFTPNDDKLNDILRPVLVGIKELKYFAVYNRYGQQIYWTAEQGKGWDGRIGGQMQNTGNYVWIAEAVDYNGNVISRKGYAVLIK